MNPVSIQTKEEFDEALAKINQYTTRSEASLSSEEIAAIHQLGMAIQQYEDSIYKVEKPKTLESMIALKMFEQKLKQKDLAEKLEISNAKLSLILQGKQNPDMQFLKKIRKLLGIDVNYILDHA